MTRQFGKVKWYGGYNQQRDRENHFGFIRTEDNIDLFVHQAQLECAPEDMQEYTPVTFVVETNTNKGKPRAAQVRLACGDVDESLLPVWIRNFSRYQWCATNLHACLQAVPLEKAVRLLRKSSSIFSRENPQVREAFFAALPEHVKYTHELGFLRKWLPNEFYVQLLSHWWLRESDAVVEQELLTLLNKLSQGQSPLLHWGHLPTTFIELPHIWSQLPPVFQLYQTILVGKISENTIQQLDHLIKSGSISELDARNFVGRLPPRFQLYPEYIAMLSPKKRIQLLLNHSELDDDAVTLIDNAISAASDFQQSALLDLLPAKVRKHPVIIPRLPFREQAQILLDSQGITDTNLESMITLLGQLPLAERNDILEQIPARYLKRPELLSLLDDAQQHELFWTDITSGEFSDWSHMSLVARLYTIYRAAKEGFEFDVRQTQEEHPIIQAALNVYWSRYHPELRQAVVNRAHEILVEYVCDHAWELDTDLNLDALLPGCSPGVLPYCEGRAWFTDTERVALAERTERAFCPRVKKSCQVEGMVAEGRHLHTGARLYALTERHWQEWTLLELMSLTGVRPESENTRDLGDYITKFSGWINRLYEIRSRLRCSVCDRPMRPNMAYAKNFARYRVTIVSCDCGPGHDQNIYLNHCWGCGWIIDSRESQHQIGKFYICLHCGSGPQEHATYTQGDICPKCGTQGMKQSENNARYFACSDLTCRHEIRIPDEDKITGQRRPKLRATR